jgi:hypothetical protein
MDAVLLYLVEDLVPSTRLVLGEPQVVETLDDRVGHAVRKRPGAQGSLSNFRISSGSLVCHSQPVGFSTSLTNGAGQEITAPERDQRHVTVPRPRDVGELLDIGRHVMPGGDPGLSQLVGTRGRAVPAAGYRTAAPTCGRRSVPGRPAMRT